MTELCSKFLPWSYSLFITKNLSPEEKLFILQLGPCQPLPDDLPCRIFSIDETNRKGHFNELWSKKVVPGGTKLSRDGLSYSPRLNKLFFLYCLLYYDDGKANALVKSWSQNGYCNWQNANNNITAHKVSTNHINSSISSKIRQTTLPVLPSLEYSR